jgi:hypothetical protein
MSIELLLNHQVGRVRKQYRKILKLLLEEQNDRFNKLWLYQRL